MPILDKKSEYDVNRYQAFMEKNGKVPQDLRWGKVKEGWIEEAVYLEENGKIKAAMTLLARKIIGPYHLLYANRGPICDIEDIDTVNKLMEEAKPIVKKYHAAMIKFDPEVKRNQELEARYREAGYIVTNDIKDKHNLIQPIYNMILTIDEDNFDDMMKHFSSKTRYNIRLSGRKGVTTRWSREEEDLKTFFHLYEVTGIRDKISCRPYSYFKHMLDAYQDSDMLRIYISEFENEALSAAICFHYNHKTWYIYGASSNSKRNLMPNYHMQSEMIKWAIENGSTEYDFGGVFVLNKNDGLFKFKEGFCHREQETEFIGEIDKVYHKFIYLLFAKAVPSIKKLKQRLHTKKD